MPTIRTALSYGYRKLSSTTTTPALDSELLLCKALGASKEYLHTHHDQTFFWSFLKYQRLVKRARRGVPIPYLTHTKEFYGRDFYVDERVLIPRPETELIVEKTIELARHNPYTIADIGTGSGCIALTLAHELPHCRILASDLSTGAKKIFRKNFLKHRVKVTFAQGNLLIPFSEEKIDVIAANLPYLSESFHHPSIKFEPKQALYAGDDGLDLYRELFSQLATRAQKIRFILCEIDPSQQDGLSQIAKRAGYKVYEIVNDLQGLPRLIVFQQ